MRDLMQALGDNNQNVGAGYIERNGEQYLIRAPGQVKSAEDISNIVLTTRDGAPIYVRDIAEVALGKELRTGAATAQQPGSRHGDRLHAPRRKLPHGLASASRQRIEEINRTLPEGVVALTPSTIARISSTPPSRR